ncbi:FtsX-like permease family protein [Clostridium sp. D2Q-11]|uniref:FtsX-like permease family protein n=1 Tax=Anaeromonas frigoriresistens TaxID=2683708 RepID=A0A942Z7W9_9FIRM|nr:FtsX-like permease family protein [Anaeromonas frigoriresistens]MBS4537365.1 FtsX-like permease family protein [Anaeromonas frigoriresistens]
MIGLKSAIAMLRRKKMQSFLIGLIIMLTSLLIYIGLSLINQTAPFDEMYSRANASESLLYLDSSVSDVDDIKRWVEDYNTVKSVSEFSSYDVNVEYMKDDEKVNNTILLTEFIEDSKQDIVYIDENEIATEPNGNEIYIPNNFASNNEIEVGDTLKVNLDNNIYELIVAKLVVDPQFNNGFMSPFRCFVAEDFFEEKNISSNITLLGIKYKDFSTEKEKVFKKDFGTYMLNKVQPSFIKYSDINAAYNMIGNIIASALLLVSIFMFIIVIFIIRVTIRNQILQQYKTIGVRKVIGYSKKQIMQIFIYMYIIIGIIASSLGALLGVPVRNMLEEILTRDMKVRANTTLGQYFFITIGIILVLLLLFVFLTASKANKIKPIQAIKYGMPQNKVKRSKFSVSQLQKAPLSFVLAIKQILMDKRKTVVSIVSIMIIAFVSLTISNISGSMSNPRHFSKYLIGITAGEVSVTDSSNKSITEVINKLEGIESVESAVFNTKELSVSTLSKDGRENIPLLGATLYGDLDKNTIVLVEGRGPVNSNEIVISSLVSQKAGKTIGDYIVIKNTSKDKKYLITGIYESVMHSGLSYVTVEKNIPSDLDIENGFYWLYMSTENVIMEEIEANVVGVLGNEVAVSEYDSDSLQIINTVKTLPLVTNMILGIFLIVCGIIIFNWTLIDISKSTKVYGILKATGFSNKQMRILLIVKSLTLTVMGVFAGYILCLLTIDKVMTTMFAVTPYRSIKLPVSFIHSQGILIVLLYCVIALIATLIPTKKIASISPKDLITE